MTRHPGSIDVVSFAELLPEYGEVKHHSGCARSIRMDLTGHLEEDLRRYRNNRYFAAVADRLLKTNSTYDSHDSGEGVIRYLSGDFGYMQVSEDEVMEELKDA